MPTPITVDAKLRPILEALLADDRNKLLSIYRFALEEALKTQKDPY